MLVLSSLTAGGRIIQIECDPRLSAATPALQRILVAINENILGVAV
jgi:hypothetical protein